MNQGEVDELQRAHDPPDTPDEDLLTRVRRGDDAALRSLLDRYRAFARAKARSYFLVGGDRDDVVQEGMIGLYKAIRDYDPRREASFRSFAELCIKRQILTAIKTATRQKHTPLNSYVSFDRPQDEESDRTYGDVIAIADHTDPLRVLLDSDEMRQLRHTVGRLLSELESEVLELYVQGRSYEEIADALGRHVKSVDNALQRIKRKVEHQLRERDGSLVAGAG